ncbi:MAG TPA: hypothetical protein DCQ93_09785 [Bacteroidetes bacterium]|nr:hypothetical protein [Bacteroidota bacterium]
MKFLNIFITLIIGGVFILSDLACNNSSDKKSAFESETPVSGKISIALDKAFSQIFENEKLIFENNYRNASINLIEETESKALQDLLDGKVRIAILTHKLSNDEINYLTKKDLTPIHFLSLYDAVVMIININNKDSLLTQKQIEQIFKGEITEWSQIDAKNKSGAINIIFDESGSSAARYFKEKFSIREFPENFFALKNKKELVEYVNTHINAIGVAGYSLLTDEMDSLEKKYAAIAVTDSAGNFHLPTSKNIRWGFYPYRREVYIACAEGYPGLGTGFANFVMSDVGQTIIHRQGFVPAKQLLRLIELKKEY